MYDSRDITPYWMVKMFGDLKEVQFLGLLSVHTKLLRLNNALCTQIYACIHLYMHKCR